MFVRLYYCFFVFKQKTAYEMRISDWSSDVCSSDLLTDAVGRHAGIDERTARCIGAIGRQLPVRITAAAAERLGIGIAADRQLVGQQIGRASCRERVCQYV